MDLRLHRAETLKTKLLKFIETDYLPSEKIYKQQYDELVKKTGSPWVVPKVLDELKAKAKAQGLWNLFLPKEYPEGAGLTNVEYAHLAEIMGQYWHLSEALNCSAPDTGNMEVLAKYGSPAQKQKYLKPLLNGEIRSVFFMTEPAVASSDATNISTLITKDEAKKCYIVTGRKWWSSGVCDPRCTVGILMGRIISNTTVSTKSSASHNAQSMLLVDLNTPGIKLLRNLSVFGYSDAPHGHGEVLFEGVEVPFENLILGEGKGFEISQGRLGPGRIHHCMRTIGVAERAMRLMLERSNNRTAFGKLIKDFDTIQAEIAENRTQLEMARLLTLDAAAKIDAFGAKGARKEIAMIKVAVPNIALNIIDRALQVHGGAGVSQDFDLAYMYAQVRTLRLADGPDAVHNRTIAKLEFREFEKKQKAQNKENEKRSSKLFEVEQNVDTRPACVREDIGGLLAKGKSKL